MLPTGNLCQNMQMGRESVSLSLRSNPGISLFNNHPGDLTQALAVDKAAFASLAPPLESPGD